MMPNSVTQEVTQNREFPYKREGGGLDNGGGGGGGPEKKGQTHPMRPVSFWAHRLPAALRFDLYQHPAAQPVRVTVPVCV